MPTLTHQDRADDVTWAAAKEGLISGFMTIVPTSAAIWAAMKNPKFVKFTNYQSRTALVIMPPLFVYALTSELKLRQSMVEVAHETQHTRNTAKWAEEEHQKSQKIAPKAVSSEETEQQLTDLYMKSVENAGVRIVPGNRLGPTHQFANYFQENPFKVLGFVGVPTVAYIFHGRSGKEHLQLQMKIMHTRVYGQFAVVSALLALMGFKEYMDRNGRYITESEADARVNEMKEVREDLQARLHLDKMEKEKQDEEMHRAHEEDLKDGTIQKMKKKKKKHIKNVEDV